VIVGRDKAEVRVWQNNTDGGTVWKLADTFTLQNARPGQSAKPPAPGVSEEKDPAAPAAVAPKAKAA